MSIVSRKQNIDNVNEPTDACIQATKIYDFHPKVDGFTVDCAAVRNTDKVMEQSELRGETTWTLCNTGASVIEPTMSNDDSDSFLYCRAWENSYQQFTVNNEELTLLLQITHQMEVQCLKIRKFLAERQLTKIRLQCRHLHRKCRSILGSVRLLHSNTFSDLENRMLITKQLLQRLQDERNELVDRYMRIEALTGLHVRGDLGIDQLRVLLSQFKASKGKTSMSSRTTTVGSTSMNSDSHLQSSPSHHRHPQQQSVGQSFMNASAQWTSCDTEASVSVTNSPTSFPIALVDSFTGLDARRRKSHKRHHSSNSGLMFVRPFASLWLTKFDSKTPTTNMNKTK